MLGPQLRTNLNNELRSKMKPEIPAETVATNDILKHLKENGISISEEQLNKLSSIDTTQFTTKFDEFSQSTPASSPTVNASSAPPDSVTATQLVPTALVAATKNKGEQLSTNTVAPASSTTAQTSQPTIQTQKYREPPKKGFFSRNWGKLIYGLTAIGTATTAILMGTGVISKLALGTLIATSTLTSSIMVFALPVALLALGVALTGIGIGVGVYHLLKYRLKSQVTKLMAKKEIPAYEIEALKARLKKNKDEVSNYKTIRYLLSKPNKSLEKTADKLEFQNLTAELDKTSKVFKVHGLID